MINSPQIHGSIHLTYFPSDIFEPGQDHLGVLLHFDDVSRREGVEEIKLGDLDTVAIVTVVEGVRYLDNVPSWGE